ncbi:MAG: PEP-CTERM sorting domain-containing protein [Phycisphaerae bacterium]
MDLFAYGASSVYYDDLSLVPEPASCLLLVLGAAFGLRRR